MQRIYRRRTLKLRFWAMLALFSLSTFLAFRLDRVGVPPDDPALRVALRVAIFAPALFLGAGTLWLVSRSWRLVGAFDVDRDAGRFRLWQWRPLGWRVVEGGLSDIARWRHARGRRRHSFIARLSAPPTELRFEIRRHRELAAIWRTIAPEAVADYERATGLRVRG